MRIRTLGFVGVLTLTACRKASAPPTVLQLQTYADVRHKLSFEYPAPWALTRPLPSYLPGPNLGLRFPPSAVISVTREDEPRLSPSDFQAAAFIYAVRTGLTEESCAAVAGPATAEVGGIRFHTGQTGDAGAMHSRDDRVYSLLQGPNCFLFDLVLLRFSSDSARPMSAREQNDLQPEMNQLLASVSFE